MINLRPYLGAIRLYDEKINFILQCVPDFELISKLETKDYTRSKIIILVFKFYTMGKYVLFNWFLFAKIFFEDNLKQIKRCIKFKILSKKTGKASKIYCFILCLSTKG